MTDSADRLRIDKWLWAARFFKTRSLAAQAVDGGRVRLNGVRVKPAKEVRPGDELTVHIGELEWVIDVRALSARRGPAPAARQLYEERAESAARRQAAIDVQKRHARARVRPARPADQARPADAEAAGRRLIAAGPARTPEAIE